MRVKNGRFHKQLVSSCEKKEHSFHEHHPALSILSATKDKEGKRRHLIDRGLRRKNLRQRRASHLYSSHNWDTGENSPTGPGHLSDVAACPHHAIIPTAHLPHPSILLYIWAV